MDTGWIVIRAKPAAEELAERSLRSAGWRTYLPRSQRILKGVRIDPQTGNRIRTRKEGEIVLRPAYEGYLFAELHPNQAWSPILRTLGVTSIIQRTTADAILPRLLTPQALDSIRTLEANGFFDDRKCQRGTSRPILAVGSTVRTEDIGTKPFEGILEFIDSAEDRAILQIMLFGRQTRATVRASTLELAVSA